MRRRARRGMTLLEVLVALTIMALAIGTILATLSNSMQHVSTITENDRAAIWAQRKLDELLAQPVLVPGVPLQGDWDARLTGVASGWRAYAEPFDSVAGVHPRYGRILRVAVEVWWQSGAQRRTFQIEGYRAAGIGGLAQ